MVILGLLLILVGVLAILSGIFAIDGSAELLGSEVRGTAIFLFGVGAGVAVLWGFTLAKLGTKRGLKRRRESKQLTELSEKLERVEAERREDSDEHSDGGTHKL